MYSRVRTLGSLLLGQGLYLSRTSWGQWVSPELIKDYRWRRWRRWRRWGRNSKEFHTIPQDVEPSMQEDAIFKRWCC